MFSPLLNLGESVVGSSLSVSKFMLLFRTPKLASFAKIRTQILSRWLTRNGPGCVVIAFTSRLPGDGVSTVTTGIARSFHTTDSGRVLLLNAGRKHPSKYRSLDLSSAEDISQFSDFVLRDPKYGFDIIRLSNSHKNIPVIERESADKKPADDESLDVETSESDTLGDDSILPESVTDSYGRNLDARNLLQELKQNYDVILVDAGSLANANGVFWLLNSDANILVIDCTRTTRQSLEHLRREFENTELSIDGCILNKRKFPIPRSLYWLTR